MNYYPAQYNAAHYEPPINHGGGADSNQPTTTAANDNSWCTLSSDTPTPCIRTTTESPGCL